VVSGGDLVVCDHAPDNRRSLRAEGNGYVQGAMSKAFEIASRTNHSVPLSASLPPAASVLFLWSIQERLVGNRSHCNT